MPAGMSFLGRSPFQEARLPPSPALGRGRGGTPPALPVSAARAGGGSALRPRAAFHPRAPAWPGAVSIPRDPGVKE